MADFGANLAWVWLVSGVPLVAGVLLLISAVAGLMGLVRWTGTRRARRVAIRALALAVASPLFPAIPLVGLKSGVDVDYRWVEALAWLWVLFFGCGCWWLAQPAPPVRQPPE